MTAMRRLTDQWTRRTDIPAVLTGNGGRMDAIICVPDQLKEALFQISDDYMQKKATWCWKWASRECSRIYVNKPVGGRFGEDGRIQNTETGI